MTRNIRIPGGGTSRTDKEACACFNIYFEEDNFLFLTWSLLVSWEDSMTTIYRLDHNRGEKQRELNILSPSLTVPANSKVMQITEQQKLIWSFAFYSSCVLDVFVILETYSRFCQTTATMCTASRQEDIFF